MPSIGIKALIVVGVAIFLSLAALHLKGIIEDNAILELRTANLQFALKHAEETYAKNTAITKEVNHALKTRLDNATDRYVSLLGKVPTESRMHVTRGSRGMLTPPEETCFLCQVGSWLGMSSTPPTSPTSKPLS